MLTLFELSKIILLVIALIAIIGLLTEAIVTIAPYVATAVVIYCVIKVIVGWK